MIPRKLSYAVGAMIAAVVLATASGLVIAAQNVPAPIQAPRAPTVVQEPAPSAAPPSALEVGPAPSTNETPAASQALEDDGPLSALAPANPPAAASPRRAGVPLIDLASPDAVIDLGPALVVSRVNDPVQPGDAWFTLGVENRGAQPISRVLIAADTPGAGVAISPYNRRPTLREVAASESAVIVEQAYAYGGNAFRVTLPAAHATTLALHFEGMAERPSLLAWTESALVAHNRRVALLFGTVSGLFLAALAFAGGIAVLSHRPFAKWAALFIAALFFVALTTAGTFDNSWLTATGGPYALTSLALALAVAAGVRLLDHVAPYEAFRPWARLWADRIAIIIVVLGFASFFGVPGIGLLIRIIAVGGAAAAAGYLAHCGRLGVAAARRLAPAATIFALVTAVAALRALGLLGNSLVAPAAIAGISAAGAMLVALAAAVASSEPSVARLRAMRDAHREDDVQASSTDEAIAETREHAAVAASHQGVFDLELDSGLLSLSPEAAAILGLPAGTLELQRESWLQQIHPEDRAIYLQALDTYRQQPDLAFRLEFRARGPAGRTEWYELRATMTGESTEAERCLGLIADVTARKSAESAPAAPVRMDPLTGLGNRLALFERLDHLRTQFPQLALLMLDLDRFKSVNTAVGHDAADALLKAVGARLGGRFERTSIYRVGGDTFAVVTRKPADLQALGNALLQSMSAPFTFGGREIFLPTSVGVTSGEAAGDPQEFLTQAELAMVQAKRSGGGRACVYSDALARSGQNDSVALDTDLRRAIERGEIELHYQPIVRLEDRQIAGFEALLRWIHPERGIIEPENFIPYAEQSGLIVPLGLVALKRAAQDLSAWHKTYPLESPLFVSVNITWRQITDHAFMKELEQIFRRSNLPERTLTLEVTESTVMSDTAAAEAALTRLRELGAALAIDDFGTGHSSLSHLSRFPFDAVKIDKSFAPGAEKSGAPILASIITLAHELGLEVVAEGVETSEQAKILRTMGCEYGQGFFFSAPMPAVEIRRLLERAR